MKRGSQSHLILGCMAIVLLLTGCSTWWGVENASPEILASAPYQQPNGVWEVTMSVADMPGGGLAGVLVQEGGFVFTNIDEDSIHASGLNGFLVTAQDFSAPSPSGVLAAVHPAAGITAGKVLKLSFRAKGTGTPAVSIQSSKLVLSSDEGTIIEQ